MDRCDAPQGPVNEGLHLWTNGADFVSAYNERDAQRVIAEFYNDPDLQPYTLLVRMVPDTERAFGHEGPRAFDVAREGRCFILHRAALTRSARSAASTGSGALHPAMPRTAV